MDPVTYVRTHGGVVRSEALRDAGASRHTVHAAVTRGHLIRPRRGWLATPDADPALLAAACVGVVVTCVTQAARMGLWDIGDRRPHAGIAPHHRPHSPTRAVLHWSVPLVPRDPGSLEDPIENVLTIAADCQPFESALMIWEAALRQGKVDRRSLATLRLRPRARRLLAEASQFSDAGTESILIPRLLWMRLPLRQQVWILGSPVDLLIGDCLVVQVDGGHHVDEQRLRDNAHDARLRLAGYHVIRVGYRQVFDDWPHVHAMITGAVARGLHLRTDR